MLFSTLLIGYIAAAGLPNGYEGATWGMTSEDLRQIASVQKIEPGDTFNYAEHLEEDPDVYIRNNDQHERIEYYFFEGQLYKIFIVYDRILYHSRFYDRLIEKAKEDYGHSQEVYQEELFGLRIQHTLWEDAVSILDLRKGAGFIYQVRIHKDAAQRKDHSLQKKIGI
jgi:hypothetical protein